MPGANRHGNELKSALNRHLWKYHGNATGKGSALDRMIYHDELHAQGNDDLSAGYPLHRHEPGTLEEMEQALIRENPREGEGTE